MDIATWINTLRYWLRPASIATVPLGTPSSWRSDYPGALEPVTSTRPHLDGPTKDALPSLRLYLYGPLRARVADRLVIDEPFTRRKAKALLALLYLERSRYLSKDGLLDQLWPNADHVPLRSGRLKQTALVLRRVLEAGSSRRTGWTYIVERNGSYFLDSRLPYHSDLEEFGHELDMAYRAVRNGDTDAALDHFQQAFALRRGELLPEFRHDDWAASHIAAERERYVQALEDAAQLYAARGEDLQAVELLKRAIREDPLRESSTFELMRQLRANDPPEAIRVYKQLQRALERRLQLEPDPEITALFRTIKNDRAQSDRNVDSLREGVSRSGP